MKKVLALIFATVLTAFLYCSCGNADNKYFSDSMESNYDDGYYGWADEAYDAPMEVAAEEVNFSASAVAAPEAPKPSTASGSSEIPENSDEKIIKNGNLSLETLEFDKFISELETSVSTLGGYVESNETYGSVGYRYANYTVRVPSQSYSTFIKAVGDMGTVISMNESISNVTLTYIDIEARLSALTAERDSFQKLMDRAETIEEILQIQGYLTDVNYKIESYTSQLNSLKNKVSYSTVRLNISEVERVTPPAPKTVGERISTQLSENLYNISEGSKDFAVWFVSSLPYLAIYAVIIIIAVVIGKKVAKNHRKKQEERLAAYNNRYGLPQMNGMYPQNQQETAQNSEADSEDSSK